MERIGRTKLNPRTGCISYFPDPGDLSTERYREMIAGGKVVRISCYNWRCVQKRHMWTRRKIQDMLAGSGETAG